VVRDPSLAGLLTIVLISAPLSLSCAVLRAWLLLAVERERQATARMAIWHSAGAVRFGPPVMPGPGRTGSRAPASKTKGGQ
jgi:hypothetical protein